MNNLSLGQKQQLSAAENSQIRVSFVAYDPTQIGSADSEGAAVGAGLVQFYKESSSNLVEVIYTTKPLVGTFETDSATVTQSVRLNAVADKAEALNVVVTQNATVT